MSKLRGVARRRRVPLLVAALGVALAAAGCGGGSGGAGVAQAGTPTTNGSSHGPTRTGALAFSQCMRSHGVPDFPDPGSSGRIGIQGSPGSDLDPRSPAFASAQQACKAFAPAGAATAGKASRADFLGFSRCMRRHGLRDFPDPSPQGGVLIQGGPSGDLDPSSPVFQAAQHACQHLLPGGGRGIQTQKKGPS